jgi:hypothetical protein
MERYLLCLRHYYTRPSDEEIADTIWQQVQSLGGHLETGPQYVDFYVRDDVVTFLLIKYPDLVRIPALDYVV